MTSMPKLKEEEKNFTRFFFLNFKVSPEIARRFFDGVFPPTSLAKTINNSVPAIINLYNRKRINAVQLDILRGIPGTKWSPHRPAMPLGTTATSSKDFDLTMLICLLRNLGGLSKPSNGWDQLPHPNDTLPGADLATLKWFRNQFAHTTVTSMDKNEFTDKWKLVEKALTSLNKGQRPYEVTEILNYDLDGEQAKTLSNTELKKLKKECIDCEMEIKQIEIDFSYYREGNIPKNIAEANDTLVETWLQDDESFYETRGSELVYDKIKSCCCILVTASSGFGKTAIIRHIAFKFKLEGFEIVPIESPEDIIIYKTNKKQVFLIDDVLGKCHLSPTLLEKWESLNGKLLNCLETDLGSNKILCTLRLQIALQKRFKNASTILNKEVINLEHQSNALSKDEKQKILIKHLSRSNLENKITTEEIEIMCETNYAFPLLCKLISNNEERFRKRIAFFRQPFSVLKEELDKMSIENKTIYCILVLCMLFNGSFSRRIFDLDSDKCDEKIYRIMQTCGLQRNMSKKEIEDGALSAIGSYFTKDSDNFRFIHDALEETIGCHFYTFDPKVMFSDCDIVFIRDRVRVISNENTDENINENIVSIREDELNEDRLRPLYNRLWIELKNGRFSSLLMSHLFSNRNFIRIFGITFDQSIHTFLKKVSSEQGQISNDSVFKKSLKILSNDEFNENKDAISRVIIARGNKSTLIDWIVAFGCYEFFRYSWNKMSTFERKLILGSFKILPSSKSFFPLAVLGGSLDIVTELIDHDVDINCFSEFWETPLYIAVKAGRYDMVRLLLSNGALIRLRGLFPHVPMKIPIAVTPNKQQITYLILEYDLNKTEIHEAVHHNDLGKLRSNIRSENIDSKTKNGLTVLHYAVLLNNVEAVKVLFNEELPENDDSYFDFKQVKYRELLTRKPTPRVNIGDNNGLTAVHLAVINNNIEILSLLLHNKAKVTIRDDFYRTPLHYTTGETVTKLLLAQSSQNQCLENYRNADVKRQYTKTCLSAFMTTCLNISLQTTFRVVLRDFVNVPDKEGNTPLHSVIERHRSRQEKSDCIEILLDNGANPYLLNDRALSAFELVDNFFGEDKNINNSAKHRQLVQNTHMLFALVTFLIAFTYMLINPVIFSKESQNEFYCVGDVADSGNITLEQVTRSQYVLLTTIVFWSLSFISYDMRYSDLNWRCFIILVFIGSGFFTLVGAFVLIQYIQKFQYIYEIIFSVVLYRAVIELIRYFTHVTYLQVRYREKLPIAVLNLFLCCTLIYGVSKDFPASDLKYYYNFSTMRVIYTLNITASNCTEFNSVNILCTSLAYNITYQNDVDFSMQCRTDPNFTSYNGTLIVESGFIDWQEIGIISNFWSHVICAYCFLYCFSICIRRIMFRGTTCNLSFMNALDLSIYFYIMLLVNIIY
ncbi:uncharacterized protein LOC127723254 isoform X1 [Mytilus californianus]|uniref:uncharacterized protein LOC127723254 isoform X1 n=1 Tax=Mytilus californianus TaxID=6549 RepID=UPI0022450BE3|nr:uncharacterized protein LOC127723254 isoform X1 [Mytilus californianus]